MSWVGWVCLYIALNTMLAEAVRLFVPGSDNRGLEPGLKYGITLIAGLPMLLAAVVIRALHR